MSEMRDVVIIGATPPGLAAAALLAEAGRAVVVVDLPPAPVASPLADYLPAGVFAEGPLAGLNRSAGAKAFCAVRLHEIDTGLEAVVRSDAPIGYLVPADGLRVALRRLCDRAGVQFAVADAWPEVNLGERDVAVRTPGELIRARVAIVAHGTPREVLDALALPVERVPHAELAVAAIELPDGKSLRRHVGDLHVVTWPRQEKFCVVFTVGARVQVRMMLPGRGPRRVAAELSAALVPLRAAGVLADDVATDQLRGAIWQPPAGVALEVETHVAKRLVLIGSAGGFANVLDGQGVLPGLRSALIAADVVHKALQTKAPQAQLDRFRHAWREALADTLRPPNTQMSLLGPLLYMNQQMAERFVQLLLGGHVL